MSILDFLPGEPREVQKQVLTRIEQEVKNYDVIVVQAPTATGKSRIAATIAKWLESYNKQTAIITPTNALVDQYFHRSVL